MRTKFQSVVLCCGGPSKQMQMIKEKGVGIALGGPMCSACHTWILSLSHFIEE